MAQFYTPYQNRTTIQQPQTPPPGEYTAVPWSGSNANPNAGTAAPIAGRNIQAGGRAPDQQSLSSYKHLSEVPEWGTGMSYIGKSRTAALNSLEGARSTANPEDYNAMDEMRNYYRGALSDLSGNNASGQAALDTSAQYGLKNLLSQHKAANAGRGTMGSRQYAGAQGDIVSRSNNDYINGLIRARSDAIDQGGKIQSGLSGVQNQDLAERGFQQAQAQSIADLITQFMNMDMGREAQLENQRYDKEKALDAWKRGMVSSERDKSHEFGMGMAGGGMGGS